MTFLGLEEDIKEFQDKLEKFKNDIDTGNYTAIVFEKLDLKENS